MVAGELNGWRADPFGIHELRYFSMDGRPTRLVRDGDVLSHDPPPGHALFTDAFFASRAARRPRARPPMLTESEPDAPGDEHVERVNVASPHGWQPDPFGLHEERSFTRGEPTRLVRDSGIESYEMPPSTDPPRATTASAPQPVPAPSPPDAHLGEPADGWRPDPLGRHEYRYFQHGQPTAYVTDRNTGRREDPPHQPPEADHITPPRAAATVAVRENQPKRPKKERGRRSIPARCIDRVRSALPRSRRRPTKASPGEQVPHPLPPPGSPESSAPWRGATAGFSPEMSRSSEN
jgi:hypothetical protein